MAYSQAEESVKSDISFFKLGVLMEDSNKTIKFLQDSGLVPNVSKKDCTFCGMQKSVTLYKSSKKIIPYILRRLWKSLKNERKEKAEQETMMICIYSSSCTSINKETGAIEHHSRYFRTFSETSLLCTRDMQTRFQAYCLQF